MKRIKLERNIILPKKNQVYNIIHIFVTYIKINKLKHILCNRVTVPETRLFI